MKKKFLFLLTVVMLSGFTGGVYAKGIEKVTSVTYLERDSFYNFYFTHDVNIKSEFDPEHKLWKLKLEEVLNRKSLPEPHVEILWLKLDDDCTPKSWNLHDLKINGHKFRVFLLKKKTKK